MTRYDPTHTIEPFGIQGDKDARVLLPRTSSPGRSDSASLPATGRPPSDLLIALERRAQRRLHLFASYRRYLIGLAARNGAGHQAEDIATEAMRRVAWADELEESTALSYLQRIV